MKKYIQLSYTIAGMGGGQLYQYNKAKFMKENGYQIYILYAIPGEIVITDFSTVADYMCIEQINIHPMLLRKNERDQALACIHDFVGELEEGSVIESCGLLVSLWGELIAKKNNCWSYVYIIDEKVGVSDDCMLRFLEKKRNSSELRGVKKETYKMLFGHFPEDDNYNYCLPLYLGNATLDSANYNTTIIPDNNDLRICTIGRLDKAYVPTLIDEILKYANYNKNKRILYCMIGDSPVKHDIEKIRNTFSTTENVQLLMLGAIFPIPRNLLMQFDLFISSAGSARVSYNQGIPTISIDVRDFYAIGILGVDTNNSVFREYEPKVPLSEKLDYVVENYAAIKEKLSSNNPQENEEKIFASHLEYYQENYKTGNYFDILAMKINLKQKFSKILYYIGGQKAYQSLRLFFFNRSSKNKN